MTQKKNIQSKFISPNKGWGTRKLFRSSLHNVRYCNTKLNAKCLVGLKLSIHLKNFGNLCFFMTTLTILIVEDAVFKRCRGMLKIKFSYLNHIYFLIPLNSLQFNIFSLFFLPESVSHLKKAPVMDRIPGCILYIYLYTFKPFAFRLNLLQLIP
jgi:hypothetical protein